MVKVTKSTSSNTNAPPISQVSLGQDGLFWLSPMINKKIPVNPDKAMNAKYVGRKMKEDDVFVWFIKALELFGAENMTYYLQLYLKLLYTLYHYYY